MAESERVKKSKKTMAQRLRAARSLKGYSQEAVQRLTGYHWTTIAAYERGERVPSIGHFLTLADLYGVTPNWLFGLDEGWAEALPNHIKESLADPEFLDWLEIVFKLRQRGVPLTAAQGMAESMAEAVEKVMQALREAEDAVVRTMQGKP